MPWLPAGHDRWDVRGAAIPPLTGLNSLILAAVHELDEPTRETLAALAVWGGSGVRVADLSATLYSDDDLVTEQLDRAAGSGLVRRAVGDGPTDRVVGFRHGLYREVVYADVEDARRRALHGRVGALLRDRLGPGSSVVADHLLQAARPDQPADPAVLTALRDAVRRSAELAPAVAADLLADADSLADLGSGSEEMLRQRAQHLFVAGRGREAEQLVSARIGAVRDPAIAAELQVILLRSLVNRAETAPALEIIDRILGRPMIRPATRHWAEAQREWLLLMLGVDRSAGFEEALARYRAAGDEVTQAAQLSTMALFSHLSGDTDRALDLSRQRHASWSATCADVQARSTAAVWPAVFQLARTGPAAGLAAVATARQHSSTHDSRWIEPFLSTVAGSALMVAGDWDGAVAEFTTGLQLAEEVGAGWVSAAVGYRSYIDAHRGATASARDRLDTFRHSGRPLLYGQNVPGLAELAILEADGQTGAAAALARTLWTQARDGFPRWTFELAPEVLRVALIGLDRRLADAVNRDVQSMPVPQGAEAIPLLIGGAFAADPERLAAAVEALNDAGRTMIATVATEELAYAWAVAGDRKRAADRLNEAVAGFERMGALPDRDRALARCRQLGIRAGTRGRARTGARGWAGLTETEKRIAGLVGEGLTNPEIGGRLFISPRTVQTHVSHI